MVLGCPPTLKIWHEKKNPFLGIFNLYFSQKFDRPNPQNAPPHSEDPTITPDLAEPLLPTLEIGQMQILVNFNVQSLQKNILRVLYLNATFRLLADNA